MQTLGLASEQKPTDGIFKRLFWPTIEDQYDVDLVGRQGFWVCCVIAGLTSVILVATGHFVLGPIIGLCYFLGGLGVRERSIAAAVLIFLCFFLDKVSSAEVAMLGATYSGSNPLVGLFCLMLLLANVRGTVLAHRWQESGTSEEQTEMPERMTDSFADKVANVLPAKAWPVGKYFFFPLAGIVLLLSVLGIAMYPTMHRKQVELQRRQQQDEILAVEPGK